MVNLLLRPVPTTLLSSGAWGRAGCRPCKKVQGAVARASLRVTTVPVYSALKCPLPPLSYLPNALLLPRLWFHLLGGLWCPTSSLVQWPFISAAPSTLVSQTSDVGKCRKSISAAFSTWKIRPSIKVKSELLYFNIIDWGMDRHTRWESMAPLCFTCEVCSG